MIGLSREDLRPGSKLHNKIKKNIDERYTASAKRMSTLHERWRKNEEKFIAYLPEREADRLRRVDREQSGKPQYTTLVLPYSYAMAMSAHSYWTTVFLARSPVFQFTGRHGESQQQVQAIEALVDYQMTVGEMIVPIHIWLLDPAKFGIGLIGAYWDEEVSYTSEYVEETSNILGFPVGKPKRVLKTTQTRGYAGNKLFNIRPYDWFPDTRVALWEIQKAEYHGLYKEVGWNHLVKGAKAGNYTNIDVLRERKKKGQYGEVGRIEGSSQLPLPTGAEYNVTEWDLRETGPWGILEMYVDLIPKDWGLSELDYPEKWMFTATITGQPTSHGSGRNSRGNVDVIIGARPCGAWHNRFPLFCLEIEPEAYAFSSRSMMEIMEPLQNAMDWLWNSHAYNVRQVLNNQFIVDPSRVVMSDLLDPLPGNIIRAKPAGYNTDLDSAIKQLPVADITRAHLSDMQTLHEFGQRGVGVTDQIMGMFDAGGRKSATEVRTSSTFGINRQKTIAEFLSAMGFGPLGQVLVQTSQQYYDMQEQFKIAGDLMLDAGRGLIQVGPDDIQGAFDFVPVDGTLPIDRFAQANLWREIMMGLQSMPDIAMQYDTGRIFAWVAQLAGLKNITRFKVQVAPDEALIQQMKMGNMVPGPSGASRPTGQPTVVPEPGQMMGMGATG